MFEIPEDKVLCITGDPRSGTSLEIKTVKLLGIPVAGDKWPQEDRQRREHADPDRRAELDEQHAKRLEHAKEMNPRGFYEVPGTVMQGLKEIGEHGGKAIKIVSASSYPHDSSRRLGTDPALIHKWIWMLRDPSSVAVSQNERTSSTEVKVVSEDGEWERPAKPLSPQQFVLNNGGLAEFFQNNPDRFADCLVVDYDEMTANPEQEIDRLCEFLGHEPTDEQRQAATDNVDTKLRRSPKKFTEWEGRNIAVATLADDLRESIVSRQLTKAVVAVDKGRELAVMEAKEVTRYYDPETGCFGPSALHEKVKCDEEYCNEYCTGARKEIMCGLHPQCSIEFERPPHDVMYEIDLGGYGVLTRPKVVYRGVLTTWELAFQQHQRLYPSKVTLIPLADRKVLAEAIK